MPPTVRAVEDSALAARIISVIPLTYDDTAPPDSERPEHVRAASSLTHLIEHLAAVQDDANYLALIRRDDHRVHSVQLPEGPAGDRVYAKDHNNLDRKLDFEACVDVPGTRGHVLIAFGSGSTENREWVALVDWRDRDTPSRTLYEAPAFFASLRETREFAGSGLNVEGAVFVDDDTLRLFQRGDAPPRDDLHPVDATGDLSYTQLMNHLESPDSVQPPAIRNIVQYDIGDLDDTRLTFSDAETVETGILFSASAEVSPDTDEIMGSVLGIIDEESVRWAKIIDQNDELFRGKIEGLTRDPDDDYHVFFVIDDDDVDQPSNLYEVELLGPWFRSTDDT